MPEKLSPCRPTGVWSELFPSGDKPQSPATTPTPPQTPLARSQLCLLCPTCCTSCRLLTSQTDKNPNRQFYTCPFQDHKFFRWADQVSTDELIDVPYCGGCSAGVCRVRKEGSGRILFTCRIKEGQGSCGYRVWQDELDKSAVGGANAHSTSLQSPKIIVNLFKPTLSGDPNPSIESPLTNILRSPNYHIFESKATDHLKCRENGHDQYPRSAQSILNERVNQSKSSAPTVIGNHGKSINTTLLEEIESPEIDNSGPANFHEVMYKNTEQLKCQKNDLGVLAERAQRLSDVRATLFRSPMGNVDHFKVAYTDLVDENKECGEAEVNEFLEIDHFENLQYHGVTPGKIEKLECQENQPVDFAREHDRISRHGGSKDSTFTAQEEIVVNNKHGDLTILKTTFQNSRLSPTKSLPDPRGPPKSMSVSISRAFSQAAEQLMRDFLFLLEKMDPMDHQTMSLAAEDTFAALHLLTSDHRGLRFHVEEYISCATSLAEIEREDEARAELAELWSVERARLDEMSLSHAEAVESACEGRRRLERVQEEVFSAMGWLLKLEAELSSCEVEMKGVEEELGKIGKGRMVLEDKCATVTEQLRGSKEVMERKEAAKAALERARRLLWG